MQTWSRYIKIKKGTYVPFFINNVIKFYNTHLTKFKKFNENKRTKVSK